jgi:AraC-like DNA-binding protein
VHVWNVTSDPKSGGYTHTVTGGSGHALLVPVVSAVFQALGVSAALFDGTFWWSLHDEPNLIPIEVEHGVESQRWAYNGRMFAKVRAREKAVRGEHAGTSDLFVPVRIGGKVTAILVTGPFETTRPTGAEILRRWRFLTGRQGHPADPEFASYLRGTFATLTLEGDRAMTFERLLGHLAELLATEGRADELTNRAHALRLALEPARFADRMWEAAREMIGERSSRAQYSAARAYDRGKLGLSRAADQAMVGLLASDKAEVDPVDDAIRRDAFQRSATELALAAGDVISGQVGDHGVVFLSGSRGSASSRKKKLLDLADRASGLARTRFGLSAHFGVSLGSGAAALSRSYQAALGAAELALTQGKKLLIAEPTADRPLQPLRELREELGRVAQERAGLLPARFERYVEAVAMHCGYRIEPAWAHLELCFERVADTLLRGGALDEKSLRAMRGSLDRSSREARTTAELFATYRGAVADLSEAAERPVPARQDRGLRGALDYIRQHYSERLGVQKVAKIAGFAPTYFSELFRKREGTTFERYVFSLRLERAKQLLTGTDLNVTRVAELSGYGSPQYFCRVFRRVVGATPLEYRGGKLPDWAKGAKPNRSKYKERSRPRR